MKIGPIHLKTKYIWIVVFLIGMLFMGFLCIFRGDLFFTEQPPGTYEPLPPDKSKGNPLKYIDKKDFAVLDGFSSNLPIVIVETDAEIPTYKNFAGENWEEVVFDDVNPYTTGDIRIIDTGTGKNTLSDPSVYESRIKIKKRGHSSYYYDKKQFKIKSITDDGVANETSIMGMGKGSEWVLNGSLADKSMIRNYLAYRIASEIDGNNMAPDSRYCEVLLNEDGTLRYQGVYLLMETIMQGEDRVNIDPYDPNNVYSSYIVRRDRFTYFDPMLDTYGREAGIIKGREGQEEDGWIGLKYPSQKKVSQKTLDYITRDFSKVEKVIYSKDYEVFREYPRYIDVDSFIDYFLINELFGNYDAGEHSTFMYKNTGDVLRMGPVWDYDQALDNSQNEELKTNRLAFQTQTMFKELCNDKDFVRRMKKRYVTLRKSHMSEEHLYDVIDEISAYLRSAKEREYFRWAESYNVKDGKHAGTYVLLPYKKSGVTLDRYTDEFEQNVVVIKYYLHKHGNAMQEELDGVYYSAKLDTRKEGTKELLFIGVFFMFLIPSFLIMRRG